MLNALLALIMITQTPSQPVVNLNRDVLIQHLNELSALKEKKLCSDNDLRVVEAYNIAKPHLTAHDSNLIIRFLDVLNCFSDEYYLLEEYLKDHMKNLSPDAFIVLNTYRYKNNDNGQKDEGDLFHIHGRKTNMRKFLLAAKASGRLGTFSEKELHKLRSSVGSNTSSTKLIDQELIDRKTSRFKRDVLKTNLLHSVKP